MTPIRRSHGQPRLLISVRSAEEAAIALAGGADIVDVKEPAHGSLGAPEFAVVASVVAKVGGRVPISVALGELDEFSTAGDRRRSAVPDGVAFIKMGLAGCRAYADWPSHWRHTTAALSRTARIVAVVYGDWQLAGAPAPEEVLAAALAAGCPALLVDTWDKTSGTLLDVWPARQLAHFVARVRDRGIAVALAGSLSGLALASAARLGPDLIAVRGAVCDNGRTGMVRPRRVAAVRDAIAIAWNSAAGRADLRTCR